jgi:hypothetical protein
MSAVASQSINDVFSATYDNYKILFNNFTGSGGPQVNLRLRSSGTDASGANYNRQYIFANNTSLSGLRSTGLTSFDTVSHARTTYPVPLEIFLVNPFQATETSLVSLNDDGQTGTNIRLFLANYNHTLTTSYDGFTIIPASGTITGSVSVYGFRK